MIENNGSRLLPTKSKESSSVAGSQRLVSRRCLLSGSAAAVVQLIAPRTEGQTENDNSTRLRLQPRLIKEFEPAEFQSISPDGRYLCLNIPNRFQRGQELRVVEIGTWKTRYSVKLPNEVARAEFFGGGEAQYVEISGLQMDEQLVVDLQGGRVQQRHRVGSIRYEPLSNGTLLGVQSHYPQSFAEWILARLPDYKEVRRLSWENGFGDMAISSDRKKLIHCVGQTLMCHRTDDLSVLWTREIELLGKYSNVQLVISARGDWVAASVNSAGHKQGYVGIYDGKAGTLSARLSAIGFDGRAISPDGTLLAMTIPSQNVVQDTAQIYEVSSGRPLATLIHDRHPARLHSSGVNSEFTPDGKRIITAAGTSIKVWTL